MSELLGTAVETTDAAEALELYTEANYYDTLCNRIAATTAGDTVAVMTMAFDPTEPKTDAVMDELCQAAARNVQVHLGVDAYSFLLDGKQLQLGPLFTRGNLEGRLTGSFHERLESLKQLGSFATGHAGILNQPRRAFTNPIAGRSHIKGAVVNNWYAVGGCNLMSTDKLDMMVGGEDLRTARWLYQLMSSITAAKSTRQVLGDTDFTYAIDGRTKLVVDAGRPKQSLILAKAHELLNQSQEWALLSCQFFPGGSTGRALSDALARGVQVHAIYNKPGKHGPIDGLWQQLDIARQRWQLPPQLFEGSLPAASPLLHDKVLATENGAAVGSHNYVATGVRLGTPELTLFRYDEQFARAVGNTLFAQIQQQAAIPEPDAHTATGGIVPIAAR